MITFKQKGNFSKLTTYLERNKSCVNASLLDRYGKEGVAALEAATPFNTGLTAKSWEYMVSISRNKAVLSFYNTNIQNGVPISVILQYGHATKNGGWVDGKDYINPAIQPIFDRIANEAWKEVVKQ